MIQQFYFYVFTHGPKLRSHRNMYVNIYSSFIDNHQNLGTTQMSFNWWMDEQALVYPYNRMPQGHKQEQITDTHNSRDEDQIHYT